MKVIIIEDESLASQLLSDMLKSIDGSIEILAVLESVEESVDWIGNNPKPDLAFLDIQLSDDLSFDIFNKVAVKFPVVFVTAYDEYIIQSFEYNSIDYLLKPIKPDRLKKALEKVKILEWHFLQSKLNELMNDKKIEVSYKSRFVVKKGIDFVSVNVQNVAYFFSEHKVTFLKNTSSEIFIIDKTLSALEQEIDPSKFFRVNRQFIVHINAIEKFKSDNGKIMLQLSPASNEVITVSKENAPNFRKWMEQ